MVATKSLGAGKLVAAFCLLLSGSAHAGGIITAGSTGTLYFGGGSTLVSKAGATTTLFVPAPVAPPAPAAPSNSNIAWTAPPAAAAVALPPVVTPTPTTSYDAFINFGTAPYLDQQLLTTGTPQDWSTSPALVNAYGHTPSAAELSDFSQGVLQKVESTFASSGLSINATLDPNAHADHMLSVVSGLSAKISPDAVGVTNVGHNGFDFIDKLGYASSPQELEWAVAHNVSHELMHAFGGEHHTAADGKNLDAPVSDWSVLVDPNTKFSAASVAEMTDNIRNGGLSRRFGGVGGEELGLNFRIDGQEISGQPVPEPATLALWGGVAGIAGLIRRSKTRRAA